MNKRSLPHKIVDLTPGRRIWLQTLDLSWTRHPIFGLLEVDVTHPRRLMAAHKAKTGEGLSFTAFLACCLARAVDEDKTVQAYRKGRRQIVVFEDVDVAIMVENQHAGQRSLMGHVLRSVNHRTFPEIHREIRRVQSEPPPAGRGMPGWYRSLMLLPWPLSNAAKTLVSWASRRDPAMLASMAGTVDITSVGMFGGGHSGWGLTTTGRSLGLVVGGIASKPAAVDGRIETRDILSLTVAFDHDVIDGGPATRFTRRLVELIENAYGLDVAVEGDGKRAGSAQPMPAPSPTIG
ncbi:MAG TPA: 2-oxo acid dehydrogenase subunit E2 [Anaerolineales bacterium]|nr:2-oxo acid dehydrogenase subunit E2 [Anaerolineales bacterium]